VIPGAISLPTVYSFVLIFRTGMYKDMKELGKEDFG
jgi:hypothetical protein